MKRQIISLLLAFVCFFTISCKAKSNANSIDEIKKIPQILENPVLILKSKNVGRNSKQNSRMVIYGTIKASNGNPMLAVLDLKPVEKNLLIEDMQKITSAYTKDNNPVDFVKQSEIVYADKNLSFQEKEF